MAAPLDRLLGDLVQRSGGFKRGVAEIEDVLAVDAGWLDQVRPAVLIHGHTHPTNVVRSYGSTHVEYVYGSRIIEI